MKILRGNLTETRFEFPDPEGEEGPMKVTTKKTYKENQVAYMADELGLHRVTNEGSDFAVSLHCEMPPANGDTCPPTDRRWYSVHTSERGAGRLPYLRREDRPQ